MKRALYVPCYPGELGWELINYAPHINYKCDSVKYDEVHIVVRKGRESIYPMGTHFYPIKLSDKNSMGNNGKSPPKNNIVSKLLKRGIGIVDKIKIPTGGCRYLKKRKFFKYQSTPDGISKWSAIPDNAVVLCVRGRKCGPHKNWNPVNWVGFCHGILDRGFVPVITGVKGVIEFEVPNGGINLLGKTSIKDLMAIMQRSKFVTGLSTGSAHFASLCGVPHAIWGSARIRERYIKTWNPFKTPVEYYSCKVQFECSVNDALRLVDRMIKSLRL